MFQTQMKGVLYKLGTRYMYRMILFILNTHFNGNDLTFTHLQILIRYMGDVRALKLMYQEAFLKVLSLGLCFSLY